MSVFRAQKGQIYWQSHELDAADVQYLKGVFRDEAIAAWRAEATAEYLEKQSLLNDLHAAIHAQKDWWKTVGASA